MHRLPIIAPDALAADTFAPVEPTRFEPVRPMPTTTSTEPPGESPAEPSADHTPRACGAKTRRGTPCPNAPMHGRRRCRMHGGASPGAPRGNQHARKHGGYAVSPLALTEDERAIWDEIDTGIEVQLEEALRLSMIRTRRIARHLRDVAARGEVDLDAEDALTEVSGLVVRLVKAKCRTEAHAGGDGELDYFLAALKG